MVDPIWVVDDEDEEELNEEEDIFEEDIDDIILDMSPPIIEPGWKLIPLAN